MPSESHTTGSEAIHATQDKGSSATAPRQEPGGWSARATLGRRTQREEGASADGQERPAKRAPIAAASSSDGYDSETSSASSSADESGYSGSVGTFASSDSSSGASQSSASSRSSNPSIPSIDSEEHRGMEHVAAIAYENAANALDQANHPEMDHQAPSEAESSQARSVRSQDTYELQEVFGDPAPANGMGMGMQNEVIGFPPAQDHNQGNDFVFPIDPALGPAEVINYDSSQSSHSGQAAGQHAAAQDGVIEISDDTSSAGSGSGNADPRSAVESSRTAHPEGSVDAYRVRAAEVAASANAALQSGNSARQTSQHEASQGEVINISDDSSSSRSAASNNRSVRAASNSSESVQVVSERQGNRASSSDHGLDNRTREARGR